MSSLNITPSGGLLTNQFIEAIQQPTFNHPALAPETFALPGKEPPTPAELERTIGTAWELLVERWDGLESDLPGMDISTLRSRWIIPFTSLLDLELEYQRADLVLGSDDGADNGLRFPISHLAKPAGVADSEAFIPVHTVLPVNETDGLDTRPGSGGGMKRLAPHDLLQRYLNLAQDALWGLVTDGLRLRLLRDYHHTYTRGYIEFDLQGIFTTRDFAAFRALYRLCHASRFLPMASVPTLAAKSHKGKGEEEEPEEEEAISPLESFYQYALSTGVKVGDDLRENVRAAIEMLVNGFLQSSPGLLEQLSQDDGDTASRLYDETLHIIYRLLFLLFAEQRGMLPGRGSLYMEEYSLTALRARAERPVGEDPHLDLWERLKTTFQMVEKGVPELGVFGYNGALFATSRTPSLTPVPSPVSGQGEMPAIANDALLRAVRALTTIERERVLQRISYADLSVEEMGSVYESLLDYSPRLEDHEEQLDGRTIRPGEFFLDPRGKERKTTGSYYTHPSLVNELIRSALLPVLEDRLQKAAPGYEADHPEILAPEERKAATQALLDLKVVDPACGSGAFLIAANNLLGQRLAQLRAGDLYPPETQVRAARREALAHCIYGVDLNPMAVELCKVSLWINAAVADQKLNFLDHHIKPGNSLVGIGPNLPVKLENEVSLDLSQLEIPDEAYAPLSMDDRTIARAARDRNKQEIKQRDKGHGARQVSLWQVTAVYSPPEAHYAEITDLSLSDPNAAEQRYRNWAADELFRLSRFAADVWTAAFFWNYDKETANRLEPPTEARLRLACEEGESAFEAEFINEVVRLADEHCFFHWLLEFPEVFTTDEKGGFDIVLGNPPWEKVQPEERAFFNGIRHDIATATGIKRKRLIDALQHENLELSSKWNQYKSNIEKFSRYSRSSNVYPLSAIGNLNTATLFTEKCFRLINAQGYVGIIVPSGIATNEITKDFFSYLTENGNIRKLYDFENHKKFFADIDSRFRFCLLILSGKNLRNYVPDFCYSLTSTDEIQESFRHFTLDKNDIDLFSPNTKTSPTFKTNTDAEITKKIYKQAGIFIIEDNTESNPWNARIYAEMFNMTRASHLFLKEEELQNRNAIPWGNLFKLQNEIIFPIYEARMIQIYDHRAASIGINSGNIFRSAVSEITTEEEHQNPYHVVIPRYWMNKNDFHNPILNNYKFSWFIGFRMVTSATNERTMIVSVFPKMPYVNTISGIFTEMSGVQNTCLVANLSSMILDFATRQRISGVALNFFVAKQLPIFPPNIYREELIKYISFRVFELVYTAWDLKGFADDIWSEYDDDLRNVFQNYVGSHTHKNVEPPDWVNYFTDEKKDNIFPYPPFIWNNERRNKLCSELDGIYAHLYGLHRDELDYILDTFPIVRRKDEEKFGEYRTKRLVLEAYDAIAAQEDYEELIPAKARQRSQVSVIGNPAAAKGPVVKAAGEKTASADGKPAPTTASQAPSSKPRPSSPAQKPVPAVSTKPQDEKPDQLSAEAPPPSDFGLYRCLGCGKRLMGFDIHDHTRRVHNGKEPGYEKIK